MNTAETKCKFCGAKVIARWDNSAEQEAVDRFFPLLVCNPCADNHRLFNDSRDAILTLCFAYARENEKGRAKIHEVTKAKLLILTRGYARTAAYIQKAPHIIWTPDFVDLLIEQPHNVKRILFEYREGVRRSAQQQPAEPEVPEDTLLL